MRLEQEKRELVLVEVRHLREVRERRCLIRRTCLPSLDEVAACAPAFRNLFPLIRISRKRRSDNRESATSDEQKSERFRHVQGSHNGSAPRYSTASLFPYRGSARPIKGYSSLRSNFLCGSHICKPCRSTT